MNFIQKKLKEYQESSAFGALSGAEEVLEFLEEGKEHSVYNLYRETCRYGDWEKANGIEEILKLLDKKDLLKEKPLIHFEAEVELEEEIEVFEQEEKEFTINLASGSYELEVEIDKEEGEFSFIIYDKTDTQISKGRDYKFNEKAQFSIKVSEAGVCKVEIYTLRWCKLKNIKITKI